MKKLFGCVCVCQIFLPVLLLLCTIAGVKANNIRVEGKTRVTGFTGDTAVIEVTLRWDNSWRDDFNWDAAWVFFKYKKRGLENPWQHAYLSSSGHLLNASAGNEGGGYAYMVGANAGKVNGLYVMRNGISEGNVSVRLQVKWPLNGTGLTSTDFGDALNGIYIAVHAIEMVYIPYGAYYLGDASSYLCFHEYFAPDRNPIRTKGYESLSASSVYGGNIQHTSYGLQNAIDDNINSHYHSAGRSNEWFMVDFGEAKTMRYFTIRTHYAGSGYYVEGSNDGSSWSTLWSGNGSMWSQTLSKHKITNPGAYRYYRFRETGNYLVIYDVALLEDASPVAVDSEDALTVCLNGDNSFVSLEATYPKGYAGFYVMKYETSQEQYVEFLNSLTLEQQKARVANNNFATMKRGDYVFGDINQPSCRNGIVFIEQRKENTPVVFGNNLNPANDLFSTDDGQTLACNYMSIEDMMAYCSWSGLRPMSELEYEKACRRFYPQVPDKGEYAWNTNNGVNSLSSLSDLNFRGDEREQALSYLKNVNSGTTNNINGPVRCGMFGTSATNQSQSGGTYWGVMEMSGNLKELCANVNYSNLDGGSCGAGEYNTALWNTTVDNYAVRGGGFSSPDSLLRTSDRTEAMNYFTNITQRDSTVGFRGVYSLSGIKIDGGEIKMSQDTACWGETDVLNVVAASCPDFPDVRFQYNWYVKKPGEAKFDIIANAGGESLTYEHFENKTAAPVVYTFKRTGICAMGVAESNEVTVKVLPEPFVASSYTFDPCPVAIPHRWEGMHYTWKMSGVPKVSFVDDGEKVYVSGIAANGNYTLEVQWEQCPDVFSVPIEVKNIFAPTGATTFAYTGTLQCIVLPAGKYKMEAWGAHGGTYGSGAGGYGAYTSGVINLPETRTIYIYTGQAGDGLYSVTFNGGGNGGYIASHTSYCRSGGGASDIRLEAADYDNFESLKSRIIVAAGGAGGLRYSKYANGGHAGGLKGYDGSYYRHPGGYPYYIATGASQTSGGVCGGGAGVTATGFFGLARWYNEPTTFGSGGGGGYYGGGGGASQSSVVGTGGGGSSFISGHNGCDAISASSTSSNIIHTGQSIHYSGLYFTNTVMIDGAGYQWTTTKGSLVNMPNLTGSGTMTGNTSHGQVRITPLN